MSFTVAESKALLSVLERHLLRLKPYSVTFMISNKFVSIADCRFYQELEAKLKACREYLNDTERNSQTGEMTNREILTQHIEAIRDFIIESDKKNLCYTTLPSYCFTFEKAYLNKLKEVHQRSDVHEVNLVEKLQKIQDLTCAREHDGRLLEELSATYDKPNSAALQASIFARYAAAKKTPSKQPTP